KEYFQLLIMVMLLLCNTSIDSRLSVLRSDFGSQNGQWPLIYSSTMMSTLSLTQKNGYDGANLKPLMIFQTMFNASTKAHWRSRHLHRYPSLIPSYPLSNFLAFLFSLQKS